VRARTRGRPKSYSCREPACSAYKRKGKIQKTDEPARSVNSHLQGAAPDGEGPRYLREGKFDIGGKVAVNASGGLISRGHPLGATGACGIAEIVWQLRGDAGGRQQPGAKAGMAHVIGLTSACTLNVITK